MKRTMRLVAVGLVLAFSVGQEAWAAQQKEEDSVYRWGRWAVLSPAAGGEAYTAAVTPDAANNARPGEAIEFQPEVASVGTAPIPPVPLNPIVVINPPGQPPPTGDPRDGLLLPPVAIPTNPPSVQPPSGDPRDGLLPPPT